MYGLFFDNTFHSYVNEVWPGESVFLIMDEKKCGTGGQIIINSAERGTMELCIDEKHPAFDLFPTENYTTPQWWKGMTVYKKNGCTMA